MTSIEDWSLSNFILSYFSAANLVATAIWELEIFLVTGLVGRRQGRQGYNCDLGTPFLVADEGDSYNCYLGTRVLGGRPSWKMDYSCNLGSRGFLWWLGWPSSTTM